MSEGTIACNRCGAHGPGTGRFCTNGKPWDGGYRSWYEYSVPNGWAVVNVGTKQARPICEKCNKLMFHGSPVASTTELDALKLENARLRIRVGDLEDACKAARRALRKVRLLAMGMAEHRFQVTHVDRERGVVMIDSVESAFQEYDRLHVERAAQTQTPATPDGR